MLNNQVIGPIFFQENLTEPKYLQFFEESIHPFIMEENLNEIEEKEESLYFQ